MFQDLCSTGKNQTKSWNNLNHFSLLPGAETDPELGDELLVAADEAACTAFEKPDIDAAAAAAVDSDDSADFDLLAKPEPAATTPAADVDSEGMEDCKNIKSILLDI